MRFSVRLAVAVLALGLFGTAVANANAPRVTEGDAQAVFQAYPTGGSVGEGAPSDGLVDGLTVIRPFAFFNGKHYCSLDWHVAMISFFERGTYETASAALAVRTAEMWIDGNLVETERTSVRRSLATNGDWWFSMGALLSPSDLAVGAHTFRFRATRNGVVGLEITITIHVDAPETGTCV